MRVKHAVSSRKRTKKVLESAKGYWGERSKKYRRAVETVRRAGVYAYRDRRMKKRVFSALWITRINAAARERGATYRQFMTALKSKNIILSRNVLAAIAADYPQIFDQLFQAVK